MGSSIPVKRVMKIADMNFLVVQEDDLQRHKLGLVLDDLGARNVIASPDSTAALAVLQDQSQIIDIGFIDLHMSGMDGMELIRHMGNFDSATAIIMSGVVDPALIFSVETMSKAYGINLLGFVQKPATNETLSALIGSYTASRRKDNYSATMITPQFSRYIPGFSPKLNWPVVECAVWKPLRAGIIRVLASFCPLTSSPY
jgi:DNA-binding NtrC family response regulator